MLTSDWIKNWLTLKTGCYNWQAKVANLDIVHFLKIQIFEQFLREWKYLRFQNDHFDIFWLFCKNTRFSVSRQFMTF